LAKNTLLTLAKIGVGMALLVVILGAYTRLVDAGLGCPDWPGCYGFLTVPESVEDVALASSRFPDAPVEQDKAWWEMIHRYLVILQGAFGAWTVTLKLWPQVVTAHLLGGFATLSLLWLLCLRLGLGARWQAPRELRGLAAVGLGVLILQIALGGWVTSNYAALACPDFPTCHGEWLPDMNLSQAFDVTQSVGPNYLGGLLESDARVGIQVVHRLGAVVVLLAIGLLGFRLLQAASPLAWPLLGLLTVQLLLGVLNVVLVLPLANATAHNAFGALLLLAMVTVNYRARVGSGPH